MPAIINKDAEKRQFKKGKWSDTTLNKTKTAGRGKSLKTEGASWTPAFKDLSNYIYPTKGFFHATTPNQGKKIDHKKLIDSHATMAVDIMASGMLSGLTSPARPWFRLGLSELELAEHKPIKMWLEEASDIIMSIFQRANIYNMLTTCYTEIATFGTACAYIGEDFEKVLSTRSYTAGEYFIGRKEDGMPNAFYREYWLTVGQLVETFGLENCSMTTQQQYNNNKPDQWIKVHFLIEENDDRIPSFKDYSNMAFRSAYWEENTEDDSYLKVGGYEEFPIIAPRWDVTTTTDSFGRGPGWKALGDVKMLQKLQKNKLIALDKQTNPPLQADASVVGEVNTLPGGVTRFSAQLPNAGVKTTYEVNVNMKDLEATIDKTKDAIGRYFFTNLFLMMIDAERSGREMTATEIMEKQAEKVTLLGPILERLEKELLDPLIERVFNIALRGNLLPPPPEEMRGRNIKIQYISALAQAQKMAGITSLEQFTAGINEDITIDPSAGDIFDRDEKNRAKADMLGIPNKLINSPEKILAIRKARAEQAAELKKQENMLATAEAAKKGAGAAKDLANAPVGEGTMLDQVGESIKQGQK